MEKFKYLDLNIMLGYWNNEEATKSFNRTR